MFKKHVLAEAGSPFSKAAAFLVRGAYTQYVSTAQWRERRWRLFPTFPFKRRSSAIGTHMAKEKFKEIQAMPPSQRLQRALDLSDICDHLSRSCSKTP